MKQLINTKEIFSISTISIFFLFLLMLWSMEPWFAWNYRQVMITALSVCFLLFRFILFVEKHDKYKVEYSILITFAFAYLVYFFVRLRHAEEVLSIFNFIRAVLVIVFVMAMKRDEKKMIVDMTTNMYAGIVGISMIVYLLVVAGIKLPYSVITKPDNLFYPPFWNYKIFIIGTSKTVFFQRFQAIFTEPGHLSTVSALLVYINRYELKRKSVLIIFISVIMSFSLSGYVLLVIGYLIRMTAKSRKVYVMIFKITAVTALLFGIGLYYYTRYPDSILSRLLLSRLELDENRGIRGNNRTSQNFNYYYETQFLTSTESIIWGANLSEFQRFVLFGRGGNNSYKVFILNNGVISLMLLFLMYFSIAAAAPSRMGLGLLILYSASFIQRTQTGFWEITLFLFIGAAQYFHIENYDNKLLYNRNFIQLKGKRNEWKNKLFGYYPA